LPTEISLPDVHPGRGWEYQQTFAQCYRARPKVVVIVPSCSELKVAAELATTEEAAREQSGKCGIDQLATSRPARGAVASPGPWLPLRSGRLGDPRLACLRQVEKEESRWRGSPAARLSSSRVDWLAQPSLHLAQNYFSRISWIVSIVLLPSLLGRDPGLSVICALG
jgi:hypothetical protein